jgi:hypothetical protein
MTTEARQRNQGNLAGGSHEYHGIHRFRGRSICPKNWASIGGNILLWHAYESFNDAGINW